MLSCTSYLCEFPLSGWVGQTGPKSGAVTDYSSNVKSKDALSLRVSSEASFFLVVVYCGIFLSLSNCAECLTSQEFKLMFYSFSLCHKTATMTV